VLTRLKVSSSGPVHFVSSFMCEIERKYEELSCADVARQLERIHSDIDQLVEHVTGFTKYLRLHFMLLRP
jgi:hypothetical protein